MERTAAPKPHAAVGRAIERPLRGASIADSFDPRRNSLNFLRLLLAALVLVSHTFPIGGFGGQPMIGGGSLGAFSVDCFFVLSGFLITRSWMASPSTPRYAWRRFLRVFPAYWVCLAVMVLLLVPGFRLAEGRSAFSVDMFAWAATNGVFYVRESVHGVLMSTPLPHTINGSLWTLAWEIACYVGVAFLGTTGVLKSRIWVVALLATGLWVGTLGVWVGVEPLQSFYAGTALRFGFLFVLGALLHLYGSYIPARAGLAGLLTIVLGLSLFMDNYRVVGAVSLAYLLIWLGCVLPLHRVGRRVDLSYGMYIYAFPVQQTLAVNDLATANPLGFLAASLAGTTLLALASWHLIERRALGLKDWTPARLGEEDAQI